MEALDAVTRSGSTPCFYRAVSWGPREADTLLSRHDNGWRVRLLPVAIRGSVPGVAARSGFEAVAVA